MSPMPSSNVLLSQLQSMLPNQTTTTSNNDPVTQIISQVIWIDTICLFHRF
jgi:hypothetical protein